MSAREQIDLFFKKKVLWGMAPLTFPDIKIYNVDDTEIIDFKEMIVNEYKGIDLKKLKYPYKPFLLLSIFKENNTKEKLFNREIEINQNIIKNFYEFISNDYYLFEILKSHKNKENWCFELGFNKEDADNIYNNVIRPSPITHLESEWFKIIKGRKILLNFDNPTDFDVDYFEDKCNEALQKAIYWYKNKNWKNLLFTSDQILTDLTTVGLDTITSGFDKKRYDVVIREYQYFFRKQVLDRDKGKCLVCCIENKSVLEACHIKPYSISSDIEKYDINNGLTLCANHHKLFDSGYFTFDDNWKVKLFSSISNEDNNLFFLQYEDCWEKIFKSFPNYYQLVKYLNYHQENIFRK